MLIGADIETEPWDPKKNKHVRNVKWICGSVALHDREIFFRDPKEFADFLSRFPVVFFFNAPFDYGGMEREGIRLDRSRLHDPYRMAYIDGRLTYQLDADTCARFYLQEEKLPFPACADPSSPLMQLYVRRDAKIARNLGLLLSKKLNGLGLWNLYMNIDRPLMWELYDATQEGVKLDYDVLSEKEKALTVEVDKLKYQFSYLPDGTPINPRSTKDLPKRIYLNPQEAPVTRKGHIKTDSKTLKTVDPATLCSDIKDLLLFRKKDKLLGTFIRKLQHAAEEDGLVHPLYRSSKTKTGRLSSGGGRAYPQGVNIQQMPKDPDFRRMFITKPGCLIGLWDADQIELRVLAHLTGDRLMMEAFHRGDDIHRASAAALYDTSIEKISDEQRAVGKTVNFAVLFGSTPFGLAFNLNMSLPKAERLQAKWWVKFSGVAHAKKKFLDKLWTNPVAYTMFGRPQIFKNLNRVSEYERESIYRQAFSQWIQGSAAELMKWALLSTNPLLPPLWRFFLQVHDEFGWYIPEDQIEPAGIVIPTLLQASCSFLRVPVLFDGGFGRNWAEAKKGGYSPDEKTQKMPDDVERKEVRGMDDFLGDEDFAE
jgi:DNA polymerase I